MREFAKRFYSGQAWKKTRAAYMASQNFICERCGDGAYIVHHREYLTPENLNDPFIALGWDNLEALCLSCHSQEHMGGEATAEGLRFNADGEIVQK